MFSEELKEKLEFYNMPENEIFFACEAILELVKGIVPSEEEIAKQFREIMRWEWFNKGLDIDAWNDLAKRLANSCRTEMLKRLE